MEENLLITAAQNGDIDAFNELVLRYQDIAYSQALWIMKIPTEAEDCTQDAFVKAFQRLSTFRGVSFRSWLMRIVINTCMDELRRKKRVDQVSLTPESEDGDEQDYTDILVDPALSIEEQVERTELSSSLKRYLNELQTEFREIILLVDVFELDYKEAAQTLGVPVGTVKSRLARGRLHLRNRIMGSPEPLYHYAPPSIAA